MHKSKKEGKDQESIQSSSTPDPGYLWSLGNQYNVGTLSWFSLALTPKCMEKFSYVLSN